MNAPINFTDQSSNAGSAITDWSWEFGGSGNSILPNPTHIFTSPGSYTVELTVTTQYGCTDDSLWTITIEDIPVAKFSNPVICMNDPTGFTDLSTIAFGTIATWQWDFGDSGNSIDQNPTHTYISEGDYPVSLTVISQNGCISLPATITAVIREVKANAGSDTIAIQNQPHQLSGSGGAKYEWSPAIYLDNSSISDPIAVLQNDQTFKLEVETLEGCRDVDYVQITVLKKFDIYVPTAFTPNGDGRNDVLRPHAVGVRELSNFQVYNRYGQQVFATKQVGAGWDGTINGKLQGSEIFVWIVKASDLHGNKIVKQGTVVLIR